MYEELVNYCFETFPQISADSKKKVEEVLRQYKLYGKVKPIFTTEPLKETCQGDIFSEIKWLSYNDDGRIIERKEKCFLLSTTCDACRKEHLVFSPVIPIDYICKEEEFEKKKVIKSNCTTEFLYLMGSKFDDYVVDLGNIFSFPRALFEKLLSSGNIHKESSLSDEGLYLFVTKFTLAYMRWQDPKIEAKRSIY